MNKAWWKECVVYQIYPRSFQDTNGDGIGDLPGITARLPYLRRLGADVLWISPFYQSPGRDNGYDISDYQAVAPEFGTLADFDELLAQAHRQGMKLVIDLVVNHTSDQHPWFRESRRSRDNPFRHYYIWRDGTDGGPPNNWGSCFSGSSWKLDEATGQYYLHTFGEFQPDLNWDNPAVRQEIYRMMRWWCDRGVDGFRMDVISMISKTAVMPDGPRNPGSAYGSFAPYVVNGPRVHEYLQEMNREVLSQYDLLTVGECSGLTVEQACRYANAEGTELNMAFQFEHMDLDGGESFKWDLRKIDVVELKRVLSKWQTGLAGRAWNSLYWCNHDQPRIVSRLGDSSTPEMRERSAKALALCLHMMQGSPYIYQGEELGMTNYPFQSPDDFRDIESINAYKEWCLSGQVSHEDFWPCIIFRSRDNARTPVQWDDSEQAGFTTGTPWIAVNPNYKEINAKAETKDPDSVFHYYKKLIALRKENPIMVYGKYEPLLEDSEELFVYTRTLDEQKLLVVTNFTDQDTAFTIPEEFTGAPCLISNMENDYGESNIIVKPYEAFVLIR